MSVCSHFWTIIHSCLWAAYDRQGGISLHAAALEGGVWVVWCGVGSIINGRPPPDIVRPVSPGHDPTIAISYPHAKVIPGSLPKDCHINLLPSWGVPREGFQLHQPTATFMQQHMEDTIMLLDKVNVPYHRCKQCYMFLPRENVLAGRLGTKICRRGSEWNCRHIAANAAQVEAGKEFQAHDHIIYKVNTFKYLVRMLCFD